MALLIKLLGLSIIAIAILQLKRSLDYPQILSKWNIDEGKISLIVWIARVGGFFGLLIGIWLLFFLKL